MTISIAIAASSCAPYQRTYRGPVSGVELDALVERCDSEDRADRKHVRRMKIRASYGAEYGAKRRLCALYEEELLPGPDGQLRALEEAEVVEVYERPRGPTKTRRGDAALGSTALIVTFVVAGAVVGVGLLLLATLGRPFTFSRG